MSLLLLLSTFSANQIIILAIGGVCSIIITASVVKLILNAKQTIRENMFELPELDGITTSHERKHKPIKLRTVSKRKVRKKIDEWERTSTETDFNIDELLRSVDKEPARRKVILPELIEDKPKRKKVTRKQSDFDIMLSELERED